MILVLKRLLKTGLKNMLPYGWRITQTKNQTLDLVKWGRKHRISTPLFMTKEYVLHSTDVFPIEFTEIKERHRIIFGEDIFKDLDIPFKDMRLLCEQQIKGKLLHLRQAYLEI